MTKAREVMFTRTWPARFVDIIPTAAEDDANLTGKNSESRAPSGVALL
jgi:hypothetical protein